VSTSFQVGGAVVLALMSAIVTAETGSATDPASLLAGYRPALGVVTLVAMLGLIVALTGIGGSRRPAPVPALAGE
jgi:hypothetical protein